MINFKNISRHKKNKNKFKKNKTRKKIYSFYQLPNLTQPNINNVSKIIYKELSENLSHDLPPLVDSVAIRQIDSSYSPTVNQELVMIQSVSRQPLIDCNNKKAFNLKDPLYIKIPGKDCIPYYSPDAIKFLLKNLSANKHIKIDKIVTPVQIQSNCWFNTMFVTLFVSDKGRKFFHFFRQLMIEGIQSNGKKIPSDIRNAFALLNYAIEACLTGNKYAYILDTNSIIRNIYKNIPDSYKKKLPNIRNVNEAGNPIRYYDSLIYYLDNKSIQIAFIENTNEKWKEKVTSQILNKPHLPHIIILEFYDGQNKIIKSEKINVEGTKYILDSCVIRDTTHQHFSANLTCNNKEVAYDGMSFHRIVPMNWKKYINTDFSWGFEGSNNSNGTPLKWNFTKSYQMLIYYRVK
jgi:hypothetical protein